MEKRFFKKRNSTPALEGEIVNRPLGNTRVNTAGINSKNLI